MDKTPWRIPCAVCRETVHYIEITNNEKGCPSFFCGRNPGVYFAVVYDIGKSSATLIACCSPECTEALIRAEEGPDTNGMKG